MENATLKSLQELILQANSTLHLDVPAALIAGDMKIVPLEQYMDGPTAFRGTMSTSSLDDFACYIRDIGAARCFVDPDHMRATAFFDLGDSESPGHGHHQAQLILKKTAPFKAILDISEMRQKQRQMSDWLQDWLPHLTAVDGEGKEIPMSAAIHAVRDITIDATHKSDHEDGDMRVARTAMEKIEASSKKGLPAGFNFECQPYSCLGHRAFYLRLSVAAAPGEAPMLTLRLVKLEAQEEEMAQEFKEKIDGSLDSQEVKIFVGDFNKK